MIDLLANVLQILTVMFVALRFAWKHREKLEDWYYIASYQLTKLFKKDSFNESVSITVEVVGVFKSRRDPYSDERFTVRSDQIHAPLMPDSDEQRQLIFRLPPD